ncbi:MULTISPECIES: class I SAM-dependent methyltransferase [unclassified Halomonas]|uniref:class I SAM-dependent methyltransferase n=1 Tax=unclassified Halomonas TaxID=2609666 RepID=UPI001C954DDC|nr:MULTISPECIES: class I SAM-dependent methyltransferase [unclassified Halomonas]MBY5924314.1 class I SAM-dependent methyltransferase [Halomonas sp. DP4Y7-2]MBY6231356.1 class I SAM-dependent methyltransferase [Halomonas sp. DP4Y7-1]
MSLDESGCYVAIDCGCGAGADTEYLSQAGYAVHAFDIHPDTFSVCTERFHSHPNVYISHEAFETFSYPKAGIIIAHASLYFAEPKLFSATWEKLERSIQPGGVFSGDFMGIRDSWANRPSGPTNPLTRAEVAALLTGFDVVTFDEHDKAGITSFGKPKHWHIYSVMAKKRPTAAS